MEPIGQGATGLGVEDIQERLGKLGYAIDETELAEKSFGESTSKAVAKFRLDNGLSLDTVVDAETWSILVDECFELGDRTLYLRLPNFRGQDVRQLQERLNILGFSAGKVDGSYGVHTESAVKQFQESQGSLADGMCFPDTIEAIDRLRHVWAGKPAQGPHPMGGMGFARAANVLEGKRVAITGEDPISRNVAGRVWNLASATTERSGLELVSDANGPKDEYDAFIIISSMELPDGSTVANVTMDDVDTFAMRMHTALESVRGATPVLRIELPHGLSYDGSFTVGDSQTFAVMLLDAICAALAVADDEA